MHPDYQKPVRVCAPVAQGGLCAVVPAAAFWGRRWQEVDFYACCTIVRVRNENNQKETRS
jgi:hypothetical protein